MSKKLATLRVGIFGGTFDPVHLGHLRSALEIKEYFGFDELRLIPCNIPPHRKKPIASNSDRINMLKLAVSNDSNDKINHEPHHKFIIDLQEMERSGPSPSYTITTLESLHQQYPKASLNLIIGMDAFIQLPTWHQWQRLLDFANIVVITRDNTAIPEEGEIHDLWQHHGLKAGEKLHQFEKGRVVLQKITRLDISGQAIRALIQQGKSAEFLLPEKVWQYIQEHHLYGYNDDVNESLNESLSLVNTPLEKKR